MKKLLRASAVLAFLVAPALAPAQGIQVNRENRTIAVSATGTVVVDSEVAIVAIGCQSYGRTQDAAYQENTRTASKIIEALLGAGLKKENIDTRDVRLQRVDSEDKDMTSQERKEKQFLASQTWNIRVPPAEAQNVVDRAVAAGANEMEGVSWLVADPAALDAKAGAAALAKAHDLAVQMAEKFGGKVGELLFVSNSEPGSSGWLNPRNYNQSVTVEAAVLPSLKLFPQRVSRDATVYAVFALE